MAAPLLDHGWLEQLLDSELARHDPKAALAGLPGEIRSAAQPGDLAPAVRLLVARSLRRGLALDPATPDGAFLHEVRLHVGLALDLSLLAGSPFDPARRRAEVAAFLAAASGSDAAGRAALPGPAVHPVERAVRRAIALAETALLQRFHPPGDPLHGLPIHSGHVAIFRRRIARVAMGYFRAGLLDPAALARHSRYAELESALLAEALAGLLRAGGAPGARALALRKRQVSRLGLKLARARDARRAVAAPRPPEAIAAAAPPPVLPFLVEQLHLALLRTRPDREEPARWADALAAASGLDPGIVAEARIEAAAQHGDHHVWFEALGESVPGENLAGVDWQAVADQWSAATDATVERVSAAAAENLGAIVTELRETGELGQLLAKAAAGTALTGEEKRKVRAQLVDLARAIPALAIFAAPGGMLLLPLLAKLLPFAILPSAWKNGARKPGAGGAPASPDEGKGERDPG